MNISSYSKIKLLLLTVILGNFNHVQAQDAVAPTTVNAGFDSTVTIILVSIAVVLVFVIWGLSQVLFVLAKMVREKQKSTVTNLANKVLMTFALLAAGNMLYAQSSPEANVVSSSTFAINSNALQVFTWVIIIQIAVVGFLIFLINRLYDELMPEQVKAANDESKLLKWWSNLDKKIFTKAIPVEKEADVLLDHDYDGIRELDNALPPWWKYGFYVTIVVGVIYLFNFHVFGYGKNPTEEYQAEMDKARIEKEIYEAQNKDKIDEEHVPMADATGIAKGNEIFHNPAMCASCHGQNGKGGAGPNLTDDYWIHKGSLNDIYQSIKHGYPDKGMQAWQSSFTPKEISYLSSYIKSLRGTNPPGAQPPKGDLFIEDITDSTIMATKDSTQPVK